MDNAGRLSAFWGIVCLHPLLSLVTFAVALCIATRLFTASRAISNIERTTLKRPIPTVPYWIPVLGHGPSLVFAQIFGRRQEYLLRSASLAGGVCALNVFGKRCVVVADPKLRKQIVLSTRGHGGGNLTRTPFEAQRLQRVFGASTSTARKLAELASIGIGNVGDLVADEGFAEDVSAKLARQLEHAISTLTSKSTSWVDQAPWERVAEAELLPSGDSTSEAFTVSAKLHMLITHFTVPLICSSLLSPTFVGVHDDFSASFLKFATNYERFSTALPYWILPGGGPAGWAREQCLRALEVFNKELLKATPGKQGEVGGDWEGVQRDIHPSLLQSVQKLQDAGVGDGGIACWLLSVLFEVAWTASNAVFWALLCASRDEKLGQIRNELVKSGAVQIIRDESTHTKFKEPTRVRIKPEKLNAARNLNALGSLFEEVYSTVIYADESYLSRAELLLDWLEGAVKDKQSRFVIRSGDEVLLVGHHHVSGKNEKQQLESGVECMTQRTTDRLLVVLTAAILSLYRATPLEPGTSVASKSTHVICTAATPSTQGKQSITQL